MRIPALNARLVNKTLPLLAAVGLAISGCNQPAIAAEDIVAAPAAARIAKEGAGLKTAVFAGGCFWGVEGVFSHVKGVKSAVAGYHGGNAATASYKTVSTGTTQHAEAVRVVYDPAVVRYDQLLRIFFSVVADPTLRNRQGPDTGPQYRAALVPLSKEQRTVAAAYLAQMKKSGKWDKPIVAGLENYQKFYKAEAEHQDYLADHPTSSYIVRWDMPKVRALKSMYPSYYSTAFARD